MKTADVLTTMQAITEKRVKLYKTDYYDYDRPRIEAEQPAEFVWMVRETGTHIMTPRDITEEGSMWRYRFDLFSAANEHLYYCRRRPDGSGEVTESPRRCIAFADRQSR